MENKDIKTYVENICCNAQSVCHEIGLADSDKKKELLHIIANEIRADIGDICASNERDIANAEANGMRKSMIDRLLLTPERVEEIARSVEDVAKLCDPCAREEIIKRPNGLIIHKKAVPLGVVGMIYEARPNVTVDAAVLSFASGNACVLRGGKEAIETNRALVFTIKNALSKCGFSKEICGFIDSTSREATNALFEMDKYVDVIIPRGSASLINAVKSSSKIPCIETGAGNCHLFINYDADMDMALKIAVNAKLSRPSVCNAVETILCHRDIADRFIPALAKETEGRLEIRCDERARAFLPDSAEATEEDFYTEYDDTIVALGVVNSVEEAVDFINAHSTKHSEAIVTQNETDAEYFRRRINSACVYVNASTRFTDGGQFGFGAEIGISTQKLHVRGPMGLEALTTVKYVIDGDGQIR